LKTKPHGKRIGRQNHQNFGKTSKKLKNYFKALNQQILKTTPHSLIEQKTQEAINELVKVKEISFNQMEGIQIFLTQLNYDEVTKEIISIKTILTNNIKSILEDNESKNQSQLITIQAMNNNILKMTEEKFNWNNTTLTDLKNMLVKILEKPSINYKRDFETIQQKIFNASPHQLSEKKSQDLTNKLLQIDNAQEAELIYHKELVNYKNMEARNKSQKTSKKKFFNLVHGKSQRN
jgi:hypothetical protein